VACIRLNVIAIRCRGREEALIHSSGTSISRANERNEETPNDVYVNERGEAEFGAPMVCCVPSRRPNSP
jgi:hypothetical protein